jgi:hypothetical protein
MSYPAQPAWAGFFVATIRIQRFLIALKRGTISQPWTDAEKAAIGGPALRGFDASEYPQ